MFLKKFKKTCVVMLLSLFIMPLSAFAYSDYIIAGGENIGIKLNSKGIMVVGMYEVNNIYPARDAGFDVGDTIISVNGSNVSTIDEMVKKISESKTDDVSLKYLRNGKEKKTTLKIYKEDGVSKTGLYVKDNITGIGTLTFIDPETSSFGALGHEIIERSTGQILEIKDGTIFESTVTGVDRSENGTPGEKNAIYDSSKIDGTVDKNTNRGIFGTYTDDYSSRKKYKVAQPNEVNVGEAKILTVLNNKEIKEYSINITKINKSDNQKTKNILFEITDQELLDKTGGVVQGMSGSPIIQDDKIIGAVTHVIVEDPTKGYGIFITNMLEEADK